MTVGYCVGILSMDYIMAAPREGRQGGRDSKEINNTNNTSRQKHTTSHRETAKGVVRCKGACKGAPDACMSGGGEGTGTIVIFWF